MKTFYCYRFWLSIYHKKIGSKCQKVHNDGMNPVVYFGGYSTAKFRRSIPKGVPVGISPNTILQAYILLILFSIECVSLSLLSPHCIYY